MKAIRIHSFGGPEALVYEDAPRPAVGEEEVLIRVHAAGVNPVDWKVRTGHLQSFLNHRLPLVPGWDVSGTIEDVGSKVTAFKPGDAVFAHTDIPRNGTYAEYVVARAWTVALKPESLDHVQAAAVPLAALTAWQALFDTSDLSARQKVLIHAASGGVGHFAVQFAKWKGAHVLGTASTRNQDFLRELGVHEAIDYTAARFEEIARDVDVVLDTVSGKTRERSWAVLKAGGILVSTLPPSPSEEATAHGVRGTFIFVQPNGTQLATIAELIDSGHVKPAVQTVFPLSEARKAHEMSETGHTRGKIVLKVVD